MSIEASLVGKIGGGHGLTDDILTAVHAELVKGRSPGLIPALVLLQPESFTTVPGKNKVTLRFKAVRLEPSTDPTDADRIRLAVSDAYQSRESDGQGALDLGEESARRFLAYIEEWRTEQKLTVKDVNVKWRERFAAPESGVTGDYRKGAPINLHEFALAEGIISDDVAAPTDDE